MMTPDQIRSKYLEFFESKQHRVVPSSSVVPENDPTLLFTNAGMNQFKDVLLGLEKRDYVRAASVQKCIRAGGKHNDLDNVGKSDRHLTFFEMLGNWSFGEYYKLEAIEWAWEFLLEWLKLDPSRLYVSVYLTDDESFSIWENKIGLDPSRIVRLGKEDNFWSMGPTGPCGPCTEIYYDHHPEHGEAVWEPGFDEARFVEVWNLVFMESNAEETGEMTPLPIQSVDTGMGLDRIAAVMAGVDNVFQTGLFTNILKRTHFLRTGEDVDVKEIYAMPEFTSYCVVADHVRTSVFSVCDGAKFGNAGREYVLRRILRRAVRHGRELGFTEPFLCDVADAVIEDFNHVYPELRFKGDEAKTIIRNEEKHFLKTLDKGIQLFEVVAAATTEAGSKTVQGTDVFKLHDTYGFPPDLTEILAQEQGLEIDWTGYKAQMQLQKESSKKADDRYTAVGEWEILQEGAADKYVGYDTLSASSDVLRFRDLGQGKLEICLRETPFYAESGGQVGDQGTIISEDGMLELHVLDTKKTPAGITHTAEVRTGELSSARLRKPVTATVDTKLQFLTSCNHTATHLLHSALHKFVSERAFQAGSNVSPTRLRFDFSYDEPVPQAKLEAIESWVNARIRENTKLKLHLNVRLEEAEKMGAMMMFGEKYGEEVRVVEVPGVSTELCGGIHVSETNDIAYFRITSESGVAAGVRRIEAVTNEAAFELATDERRRLNEIALTLKVRQPLIEDRVARLLADNKELERKVASLEASNANSAAADLASQIVDVDGVATIAAKVKVADRDGLLAMADSLRDALGETAVALLAAEIDGKPALLVMSTKSAFKNRGLKAGDLINDVASHVDGRGGGKPTLAQAGGKNSAGIPNAIGAFQDAVRARLA